jgi:hypothetical protein
MSQGVATKYVVSLIAKQVDDHALVVWYDPERHYRTVAADLTRPETRVARYDGSFLQLRRDNDSLLNDQHPPRLLVYIPMDQGETDHALAELEAAGKSGTCQPEDWAHQQVGDLEEWPPLVSRHRIGSAHQFRPEDHRGPTRRRRLRAVSEVAAPVDDEALAEQHVCHGTRHRSRGESIIR